MEFIKKIERKFVTLFIYMLRIIPVKQNKILFCNFMGKGYGDNSKYIYQALMENEKDLEFVWAVNNSVSLKNFPSNIRVIRVRSLRYFYELVTSKIWIDNSRKPSYVRKRKGQYYIQTWHGAIALKKIEKDAETALPDEYLKCAKNDAKMTDLMLSNSQFCTDMYQRAFWYDGEILMSGSPRVDILLSHDEEKKKELRRKIGVEETVKIVLYAPTFRADESLEPYNIDFEKFYMKLKEKFGGEWMILLKLHPLIANKVVSVSSPFVKNFSKYDDIYELMCVSEILITDYSSTMFEMALTKKPVFLYASDIEAYMDDRGFYFEYDKLPFPKATNNDDFATLIENFDDVTYKQKVGAFMDSLQVVENGNASKIVAKRILDVIQGRKSC